MYFLTHITPSSSWLIYTDLSLKTRPFEWFQCTSKSNFQNKIWHLSLTLVLFYSQCQQMAGLYKSETLTSFCTAHLVFPISNTCQLYLPNSSQIHLFGDITLLTTSTHADTFATASLLVSHSHSNSAHNLSSILQPEWSLQNPIWTMLSSCLKPFHILLN